LSRRKHENKKVGGAQYRNSFQCPGQERNRQLRVEVDDEEWAMLLNQSYIAVDNNELIHSAVFLLACTLTSIIFDELGCR
jgi:hypothetical protein